MSSQPRRRRRAEAFIFDLDGIIIDGEVADPKHLTQLVSSIYHGQNRRDRPGGNGPAAYQGFSKFSAA